MIRTIVALALLLAVSWNPSAQTPDDARAPRPPLEIDTVFVRGNGEPVHDIRRDEVEVWIGGLRVPLEEFMAVTPADEERSRRTIVLVLDDITLPASMLPRAKEAARALVTRLGPDDQMAIIGLSGDVSSSTDDRGALLRTIDRYNTRATGIMRPDMLGEQVLTTLTSVARQFAESPGRRRTIVGIGSGWLLDTPLPPPMAGRELGPEWIEAMRALASANATFYVIDPGGVGASPLPRTQDGFARETGGAAFTNTNDLAAAAERIMREAANYYILRVADPPIFRGAQLRELEVKVKRRGVQARARRAIPGAR